jgi:hypothetical protein
MSTPSSIVNNGHNTQPSINVPSSTNGNQLIAVVFFNNGTGTTITPPSSSWTLRPTAGQPFSAQTNSANNNQICIYDYTYSSSDSGTYNWTLSPLGSVYWDVWLIDTGGGYSFNTAYMGSKVNAATQADSITLANSNELVIYYCGQNGTQTPYATVPTGFIQLDQGAPSGTIGQVLGYKVFTSAGATGNQNGTTPTSYNALILAAWAPTGGGTTVNLAGNWLNSISLSGSLSVARYLSGSIDATMSWAPAQLPVNRYLSGSWSNTIAWAPAQLPVNRYLESRASACFKSIRGNLGINYYSYW